MAISSIHFKPVKENSEAHNLRRTNLDYNIPELSKNNNSWVNLKVHDMRNCIEKYCRKKSGRKLQKNAIPIREAVVNLNSYHNMQDLRIMANRLEEEFGIEIFQIHIHRDEGKNKKKLNYHAHILACWQDIKTGKTLKLTREDMSKMQSTVASSLNMQRGDLKENSNRERLEAVEYKVERDNQNYKELRDIRKRLENEIAENMDYIRHQKTNIENIKKEEQLIWDYLELQNQYTLLQKKLKELQEKVKQANKPPRRGRGR